VTPGLRIGLPKGRGLPYSRLVASGLGIRLRPGVSRYETCRDGLRLVVMILKFRDIADLLASNSIELGVTGDEWLTDTGLLRVRSSGRGGGGDLAEDRGGLRLLDAPIYHARVCLLASSYRPESTRFGTIATPFLNLSRVLTARHTPAPTFRTVYGTSEALVPDIADAAIDIVESGRTCALHGLSVVVDYGTVATHVVRSAAFDTGRAEEVLAVFGGIAGAVR
jgi:ATP phosphoribosyltransferase